ncbi:MAG: hypothetical protein Q8J68_14075 [Methanolobus sp.]|uniref:hypothetical protein n=1 Tax=Methanolobus sp. TaxID=1874737 RepID=UPI00028A5822|nr:hypothetical protein [Methanolobus sp.]AFV23823.1 hypothetical protein Mpsy_1616 [Methanolobus psychrophilus R15]MDP2218400.1 hypothetical protein [Methanolobus sp.]
MEREGRKIAVDIERKRVRISISHGEDEEIFKLTLDEARDLKETLNTTIEDYMQRQNLRID